MLGRTLSVDKVSFSYAVCWNAFVRVAEAKGLTADQKKWVFRKAAQKAYRLPAMGGAGGAEAGARL